MEEEKNLEIVQVTTDGSKAMERARTALLVFGWLNLIGGIITALIGTDGISYSSYYEPTTLIIGIACALMSIPFFILSGAAKGFTSLIKHAECKQALLEKDYKFRDFE